MNRKSRLTAAFVILILALAAALVAGRYLDPPGTGETGESETTNGEETSAASDSPLLINELVSANRSSLADEAGENSDWIEFYNPGSEAISLKGYHLSDDPKKLKKWAFPEIDIRAGEYILVFASGKDDEISGGGTLHANFSLRQTGEMLILTDAQGAIVDQVETSFLCQNISYGRDPASPDIWLLYTQPTPEGINIGQGYPELPLDEDAPEAGTIFINEVLTSNQRNIADEDGETQDWIELSNAGENAVDLSGFFLSDNLEEPFMWEIPGLVLEPGACVTIFASGKDRRTGILHTNFKMSSGEGELSLCDRAGRRVDSLVIENHRADVSYGRDVNDRSAWLFYPEPTPGQPNGTFGYASMELSQCAAGLIITEIMSLNASSIKDEDGDYPDWIEIHNPGSDPVDLQNFGLSDNADPVNHWRFPAVTIQPGENLLVFASGKKRSDPASQPLHTDFLVDSEGEIIYLYDPFGRIIDLVQAKQLYEDNSYGRTVEGNEWVYFEDATPGAANSEAGFSGYSDSPDFSQGGGFFQGSVQLNLESRYPDAEIRYTLDGSWPKKNDALYTRPLEISRTTVVRAITIRPGFMPGKAATQTYFIDTNHVLPVVSLAMDPRDFDDPTYGIYSMGPNASSTFPYFGANFHSDKEVKTAFQLYETDGRLGFQMTVGTQIFGGWTRGYAQKSFALFARNRYESDVMNYPFLVNKNLDEFKQLVLRTGGQDVFRTKIRDILATRLMENTSQDYQGYREVVLYINGRYWGIYSIREKINRYFFYYNHGIEDLDSIDILQGNGSVKEGESADYKALLNYIADNDLSKQEHYEYVRTKMDIQSYMDYMILMMYSANIDSGNVRFWRERTEGGKWRWMVYDMDLGFGSGATVTHDTVWFMIDPAGTGAGGNFSTRLVRGLLKNADFRKEFIERFAYHMHNTFNSERVISIIDELASEIEPEIEMNTTRWDRPASLKAWQSEVQVLRNFAEKRPAVILALLKQHFHLSEEEISLFP